MPSEVHLPEPAGANLVMKMKKDEGLARFNRLLKLRTTLKGVAQISWNLSQLEKRYPLEGMTDNEVEGLLIAYESFTKDLMDLVDDLRSNAKPTA